MAVDNAAFVARFPEFTEIESQFPDMVTSALDTAKSFCDATLWGTRYDAAVLTKAAHLLAMTPFGENARLLKDQQTTTYQLLFKEMLAALPVRGGVSGGFC